MPKDVLRATDRPSKKLLWCLLAGSVCLAPVAAWALNTYDTATGTSALGNETSGNVNTADGYNALGYNSTGSSNTASGFAALYSNTSGSGNTATGYYALLTNTIGSQNTAAGYAALDSNTTGGNNVAVGYGALKAATTGSSNIALGTNAGVYVTTGTGNIDIGHFGTANDTHITRIGTNQTKTFIAGIKGVPLAGATVVVNSAGQLGVVSSSARYKQAIEFLADASDKLAQLRPVSYQYKSEPGVTHFGLVAEEVDKVMPELVVRDEDNKPDSVQYQELIPLLLQQVKQLKAQLERQQAELSDLRQAHLASDATAK